MLKGLFSQLPLLGLAAGAAALSMAGILPSFGFIAKEHFYEVVLKAPRAVLPSIAATVLTSIFIVAVAMVVGFRPFLGRPAVSLKKKGSPSIGLWLGPFSLAVLGLVFGIFPGLIDLPLLVPAAAAALGEPLHFELHLWPGFNRLLLVSAVTIAGGLAIARYHDPCRKFFGPWQWVARWGPGRAYEQSLSSLLSLAGWQTRLLQNGRLRIYLLTVIGVTVTLVGFSLATRADVHFSSSYMKVFPRDLVLAALVLSAAWVAVRTGSRLGAIVAMGVVGYGVALVFVQFGAPDLAVTQIIIETMTVVLYVLVFHRLPLFSLLESRKRRPLEAVVALGAGTVMALLTLVVLAEGRGSRLADYYAVQSYAAAHGRNMVNVILVDFRALDTLGEITVLALAGTGVLALLRLGLAHRRRK